MAIENDPDAILIHKLFGPDAAATRQHLDAELCEQIDEAAVRILAGRRIEDLPTMPEDEAEALSRQFAGEFRALVSNHLGTIEARRAAIKDELAQLETEVKSLEAERSRLLRGDSEPS